MPSARSSLACCRSKVSAWPPGVLRDLGQDDRLLCMVHGEHETIEEVGPAQDEGRPWRVDEEAADPQFDVSHAYRQMPQSCGHAGLLDALHPRLRERIPVQADLQAQPLRGEGKV